MKFQLLIFIIGLFNVIPTNGRLIQKNKTRNVEATQTEKPNPSIRLTRDIENYSLTGFSKEEPVQSEEFISSYRKKARFFFKSKAPKIQAQKRTRIIRDSMENTKPEPTSKNVKEFKIPTKPKAVLVKKPIPKFHDKDYDDFQSKITNSHIIIDSSDHEDEDFNLQDYDFDTNHDEFSSGRKPLEPRITRIKNTEFETKQPDTKLVSKVAVPDSIKTVTISNKRERSAEQNWKISTDNKREVDYYDDITTTKATEIVTKAQDDEYSDENDTIKEFDHKNSSRTPRSWNVNLLGQQFNNPVSRVVTKFLSVLPLFPELPTSYQIEPENIDSSGIMEDPLTRRDWILDF